VFFDSSAFNHMREVLLCRCLATDHKYEVTLREVSCDQCLATDLGVLLCVMLLRVMLLALM